MFIVIQLSVIIRQYEKLEKLGQYQYRRRKH